MRTFDALTDRARAVRVQAHGDSGFTLVEAVVALTVFAIISAAAVTASVNGIDLTHLTTTRVTAVNLAQQDLNTARAAEPSTVSSSGYPRTVTQGSTTYTIDRSIAYSTGSSCPSTPLAGVEYYLTVTDTVSWTGQHQPMRVDAVIAC